MLAHAMGPANALLQHRERYKTGVWMTDRVEATMLTFLNREKGEEQWGEDRARNGGVTGGTC
jgi:hypothetical protein